MKNILIVDDDRTNLLAAQSALSKLYKVVAVLSGAQALQYLEEGSCDLILLDIDMPQMDGFEVLRKIREREAPADIPVIFLTANNEAETETHCFEVGAVDFITKPFVPEALVSRIGRILELEDMRRKFAGSPEEKLEEGNKLIADSGMGAYQLDLNNFQHVYNFIHRFVERSGQDVQTVLFTVNADEDVDQSRIDEALEVLEQAIYNSLRRVDVSTRYSSKQIMVILVNASSANGEMVAKRIVENFNNIYSDEQLTLSYNIAKIEGDGFAGKADGGNNGVKTILVVDDDKTNLVTAKNALGEFYKIIAVLSGPQALKYLEDNTCDLILLDINMPDMDGFEVMKRIKGERKLQDIPIIFLTADNDPETENRCLEAGAVDYIIKPFAVSVLRTRIGRSLELEDLRRNLEQKVSEKTERITHIQNMTVLGMATMVESRDNSTGGHIMRTKDAVNVFARHLYEIGYISDADYLKKIARAAPMHDLGKIAIDDRILRKNGKFDDDEFAEMKRHSAEGAKVIEKMLRGVDEDNFVDIAVNVARYHHERWDGRGYPEGKAGDLIPVEARIMALADVFDALVSPRCYKPAFSYDKAFSIIEECMGTQFDPELGAHFLECRAQLEELYDSYKM